MPALTDLSNVRTSVDQANGLPNAHYIDPGVFEEEKQSEGDSLANSSVYGALYDDLNSFSLKQFLDKDKEKREIEQLLKKI